MIKFSTLVVVVIVGFTNVRGGFLSWLGWNDQSSHNLTYDGVPLINIPFEELSPEDKFIVESSKIAGLDLSELDVCQQRVLLKLKGSCGLMNEEQLSRFSIFLLNCHAETEGRPQITCTDSMGLKECTAKMDASAWAAYHAVANRARAVCYAARQIHFQAAAMIAVNSLLRATGEAATFLNSAQKENEQIKSTTKFTVQEIENFLRKISSKYRSTVSLSKILDNQMSTTKDTAAELVELINVSSDKSSVLIKMLANILEIVDKEMAVSLQLLSTSLGHQVTVSETALSQIKELNASLSMPLSLARAWVTAAPEMDAQVFVHAVWLAAAMLVALFTEVPRWGRAALLTAGVFNCVTALTEANAVPLPTLYCGVFMSILVIHVGIWIRKYTKKGETIPLTPPSAGPYSNVNGFLRSQINHIQGMNEETESINSDISNSSGLRCAALCTTGRRCKKVATNGIYCRLHVQ